MGSDNGEKVASKAKTVDREDVKPPAAFSISTIFIFFFLPHLFAVFQSPIPDCDEVYNYWEASHYLNHGYGFQTWEYSPVYAIRSWTYAALHAIVIFPWTLLAPYVGGKLTEFYFLRFVLGLVCATCETKLFYTISHSMSYRIALLFMLIASTSTGMFHASIAYLPSSFAMYTTMLGTASFMDWSKSPKTAAGIMWFGIGSIIGWPFAAALVLPFLAMEFVLVLLGGSLIGLLVRSVDGAARSLVVLAYQFWFDSTFYSKYVCVPWNIVAYNVFNASSKGPDIFGTEPWHYYIRNLLLNFGIWFPLALVSIPLVLVQALIGLQPVSHASHLRVLFYLSPVYLWLAIFTVQPHKEERFMYPIYPLIALNSAISMHVMLQISGHVGRYQPFKLFSANLKLTAVIGFMISALVFSSLRTVSLSTGYTAPLRVYEPLSDLAFPGDNVCLGKEWYRFPSSYFLPEGVQAKFIKSEFKGLLPGEYFYTNEFGSWAGTWLIPKGMNDENQEDPGKYTSISECDFLVDSLFSSIQPTELEPDYMLDSDTWKTVVCEPFLDSQATGFLGRLFWLPDLDIIPLQFRRKWGSYCLLQRRSLVQ